MGSRPRAEELDVYPVDNLGVLDANTNDAIINGERSISSLSHSLTLSLTFSTALSSMAAPSAGAHCQGIPLVLSS